MNGPTGADTPDPRRGWAGRFPPRSRPRKVDGGLKARSTRGAIGKSWWSKRFLAVLESFALGSRLTRGRAYARAGQVLALRVAPGEVNATVQGSRRAPYQARVGLAPFPDQVWEVVEGALAAQAIYSAKLLAGEMPSDIEEVFEAAGAPLFPRRLADLSLSCSCPDAAVPCKHLAASFYLLAEAFDADPFQILHWRGRDRATLLRKLRHLRDRGAGTEAGTGTDPGADPGPDPGSTPPPAPVGAALALAEVPDAPLAESLDRLWPDRFWLPPVPLPDRPATLDTAPDLLLRQLPAPPAGLGGPALTDRLREMYRRFAEPA